MRSVIGLGDGAAPGSRLAVAGVDIMRRPVEATSWDRHCSPGTDLEAALMRTISSAKHPSKAEVHSLKLKAPCETLSQALILT